MFNAGKRALIGDFQTDLREWPNGLSKGRLETRSGRHNSGKTTTRTRTSSYTKLFKPLKTIYALRSLLRRWD